jgi:hypothetical protein
MCVRWCAATLPSGLGERVGHGFRASLRAADGSILPDLARTRALRDRSLSLVAFTTPPTTRCRTGCAGWSAEALRE